MDVTTVALGSTRPLDLFKVDAGVALGAQLLGGHVKRPSRLFHAAEPALQFDRSVVVVDAVHKCIVLEFGV